MALDSTKWQYRTDKSIRYIGPAHGAAGANYVSVYELHRWLQDLADDASSSNDDYLDITIPNPSDKKFTTIIELLNTTKLDDAYTTPASEYIYGGSIIQTAQRCLDAEFAEGVGDDRSGGLHAVGYLGEVAAAATEEQFVGVQPLLAVEDGLSSEKKLVGGCVAHENSLER